MPKSSRMADGRKTNGRRAIAVKAKVATVKFTDDQYDAIAERAAKCGVRLSVWMREILLQAASRPTNNGHMRIREPNGTMT
jgi:hypothetical protein